MARQAKSALSAPLGDKLVATSTDCHNACCKTGKSSWRGLTLAGPAALQAQRGRGLLMRALMQPCDSCLQGRRAPSGTGGAECNSNMFTERQILRY